MEGKRDILQWTEATFPVIVKKKKETEQNMLQKCPEFGSLNQTK